MVKIGIIGLGGISASHIKGLQKMLQAKITAICDIDESKLREVGEKLSVPTAYRFTDYKDLIACDEVDAVEICTPNHLHIPMAIAAVKAGKAVQVEKPLGLSLKDGISDLQDALKEKPVVNMMDFSYRFKAAARYAKHLIAKGRLGKIVNVNIEYLKSAAFMPGRRLEWRFVKEFAGSGTLGDLGVHLIDMTRFLLGEFKTVCAMQSTVVKERKRLDSEEYATVLVDDITSFIAKLEQDVIANFLVTKCAIGEQNTIIYDIYGTEGVIKFNLTKPEELTVCFAKEGKLETVAVPQEFFLEEQECFVRTLLGERLPHFPDVEEGIRAQKVVDAVLQSAETGTVIQI